MWESGDSYSHEDGEGILENIDSGLSGPSLLFYALELCEGTVLES